MGEDILDRAWTLLIAPDWKEEKRLESTGDVVYSKVVKGKKLFKVHVSLASREENLFFFWKRKHAKFIAPEFLHRARWTPRPSSSWRSSSSASRPLRRGTLSWPSARRCRRWTATPTSATKCRRRRRAGSSPRGTLSTCATGARGRGTTGRPSTSRRGRRSSTRPCRRNQRESGKGPPIVQS